MRGYIIQLALRFPRVGAYNSLIFHNIDFKGCFRAVQAFLYQSAHIYHFNTIVALYSQKTGVKRHIIVLLLFYYSSGYYNSTININKRLLIAADAGY